MGQDSRLKFYLGSFVLGIALYAACFWLISTFGGASGTTFFVALVVTATGLVLVGVIRQSVVRAGAADPKSPQSIAAVPSDVHAAPIVEALEGAGIRATAVGGYTASFRAEAPGQVHVVVAREDVARARQVLGEIRAGEENGGES